MTSTHLNPAHRDALTKAIAADRRHGFFSDEDLDALVALRDACPEPPPVLEDGIYEVPDEDGDCYLRYVRDGRYSSPRRPDGALYGGLALPDDTSTWRRIDCPTTITPEQLEAAARVASYCSEPQWATLGEELRAFYRTLARRVLAAVGVTVHPDDKELT